jgi:hypothetical protein
LLGLVSLGRLVNPRGLFWIELQYNSIVPPAVVGPTAPCPATLLVADNGHG